MAILESIWSSSALVEAAPKLNWLQEPKPLPRRASHCSKDLDVNGIIPNEPFTFSDFYIRLSRDSTTFPQHVVVRYVIVDRILRPDATIPQHNNKSQWQLKFSSFFTLFKIKYSLFKLWRRPRFLLCEVILRQIWNGGGFSIVQKFDSQLKSIIPWFYVTESRTYHNAMMAA